MLKKIYFNDKFDLTNVVLNGNKVMENVIIKDTNAIEKYHKFTLGSRITGLNGYKEWKNNLIGKCPYSVGDKIMIAQAYKDITKYQVDFILPNGTDIKETSGYNDKRYVSADLLENSIEIVNINVKELDDITDENCIKFGICKGVTFGFNGFTHNYYYKSNGQIVTFDNPKDVYMSLCSKLYGKNVVSQNPLCYRIEFKLS